MRFNLGTACGDLRRMAYKRGIQYSYSISGLAESKGKRQANANRGNKEYPCKRTNIGRLVPTKCVFDLQLEVSSYVETARDRI